MRPRIPQSILRNYSASAPLRRARQLDYLASFRRPSQPPPSSQATSLQRVLDTPAHPTASSSHRDDPYETTSTSPAGPSLQQVPPHEESSHVVEPVPAMKDDGEVKQQKDQAKNERPRNREMIVCGIAVPPKPIPPGEEECCMSGCVNCVYTIFSQELEEYVEALDAARSALIQAGVAPREWPEEVRDEKGVDAVGEAEAAGQGMDPTMSAFLALENKLKSKQ